MSTLSRHFQRMVRCVLEHKQIVPQLVVTAVQVVWEAHHRLDTAVIRPVAIVDEEEDIIAGAVFQT